MCASNMCRGYNLILLQQRLQDDYIVRTAGLSPRLVFKTDEDATCWLKDGLLVQPYHYPSYKGRFCNRSDEIEWLRTFPQHRAFLWAKTGRDREILKHLITEPEWAYKWAMEIGDRELMRQHITGKWALQWALKIGDCDFMRTRVVPEDAPRWAFEIGDIDFMRRFINSAELAYRWALYFEADAPRMRPLVTESEWAYKWARDIGDREIMRDRVTDSKWAYFWARDIGDRDIMRDRITESKWMLAWALRFGGDDLEIMRERIMCAGEIGDIEMWLATFRNDLAYMLQNVVDGGKLHYLAAKMRLTDPLEE